MSLQRERSNASLHIIVNYARANGIAEQELLRDSGLSPLQLQIGTTITGWQEIEVLRNLRRALPQQPLLGLALGRHYHITTYGSFGAMMLSCDTAEIALQLGIELLDLSFAFADLRLYRSGTRAILEQDASALPEDIAPLIVQRNASACALLLHELLGEKLPLERLQEHKIFFRHGTREATNSDEFQWQPPLYFGENIDSLEFDIALLDLRLPLSNPIARAEFEQHCRHQLATRSARLNHAEQVSAALLVPAAQMPDMSEVANAIGTTTRTLRRRLAACDCSFRQLQIRARDSLAQQLLAEGRSVAAISERLGYTDPSSFSHAFAQWHGCTPRDWRSRGN